MRLSAFRRGLVAAAAITLLTIPSVSAETIGADGDHVTAGVQGTIDLGSALPGQDVHADVWFQLDCTGTSHVDAGQSVRLMPGATTTPVGGSFGTGSLTFAVGAGWPADGQECPAGLAPVIGGPLHLIIGAPLTTGTDFHYTFRWNRSLIPSSADDGTVFEGPTTSIVFILDVAEAPVNTPPSLFVPADSTVEGNTTNGAFAAYTVSAADAEDLVTPTPSCLPAVGAVLPLGSNTINCTVTDSGGLAVSGSFKITVVDTKKPVLAGVPADMSLTTTNPSGTTLTYTSPTATDIVDPAPVVSCSPLSGTVVPVGDTTVNCTAKDASGNTASASFGVHVTLVHVSTWTAAWDEPVGAGGGIIVNGSRSIPVKVRLSVDGRQVTSGVVTLAIVPCGGGAAVATGTLDWQDNGRAMGHISTADLATGCYQVVVSVDGNVAGSFNLDERNGASAAAKASASARRVVVVHKWLRRGGNSKH